MPGTVTLSPRRRPCSSRPSPRPGSSRPTRAPTRSRSPSSALPSGPAIRPRRRCPRRPLSARRGGRRLVHRHRRPDLDTRHRPVLALDGHRRGSGRHPAGDRQHQGRRHLPRPTAATSATCRSPSACSPTTSARAASRPSTCDSTSPSAPPATTCPASGSSTSRPKACVLRNDFDIVVAAGGQNTAIVVPFEDVQVTDGSLTLVFRTEVDYASIAGIEVLCPATCPPPDTTAPAGPTGLVATGSTSGHHPRLGRQHRDRPGRLQRLPQHERDGHVHQGEREPGHAVAVQRHRCPGRRRVVLPGHRRRHLGERVAGVRSRHADPLRSRHPHQHRRRGPDGGRRRPGVPAPR